ncbi:hypothetical protein D3C75_950310 [compost metagenome]
MVDKKITAQKKFRKNPSQAYPLDGHRLENAALIEYKITVGIKILNISSDWLGYSLPASNSILDLKINNSSVTVVDKARFVMMIFEK